MLYQHLSQAHNCYAWVTLKKHKHLNEMLVSHVLQWLDITQLLNSHLCWGYVYGWFGKKLPTAATLNVGIYIFLAMSDGVSRNASMESAYDVTSNAMHVWPRYGKLSKRLLLLINPSQLQEWLGKSQVWSLTNEITSEVISEITQVDTATPIVNRYNRSLESHNWVYPRSESKIKLTICV